MRSGAPKLLIGGNDSVGHICWQRRDEHVGAYPILPLREQTAADALRSAVCHCAGLPNLQLC